jgi:hypothetical protein
MPFHLQWTTDSDDLADLGIMVHPTPSLLAGDNTPMLQTRVWHTRTVPITLYSYSKCL